MLCFSGSGSCPECKIPLRRNNFRLQLFEDAKVEKEVDIRKRVLKDFNKKEEDFDSLREYNDYLEEVETIIYNLVHNQDIVETNKKIDQYKKENKEIIMKNKVKIGRDEFELEELIEEEKVMQEARKRAFVEEEREEKQKRIRAKEALIDELMFSTGDASKIVESFAESNQVAKTEAKIPKPVHFSSGIKVGRQRTDFLPVPKIEEGEPFIYKPFTMDLGGPAAPDWSSISADGFLKNIKGENEQERAGGYQSSIACMRALQEAFAGLYSSWGYVMNFKKNLNIIFLWTSR